jgi:asparagine synthase (glutamine-hydrolysing)
MRAFEVRAEGDLMRDSAEKLVALLRDDLRRRKLEGKRIPVSFSGGVDSTLLARICSELTETYCIVAGMENSADIRSARISAEKLGLDLKEIILDEERVSEGAREICRITGLENPITVSFELPTYFAMRSAEEGIIVTGQGADELFGGYAKYEGVPADEFARLRREDLEKALGPTDVAENGIASHLKKEIVKPFLCNRVISFAMALPSEAVRPSAVRKPIIREALRGLGLDEVAELPKKASQYGSGVSDMLKKAAKRRGQTLSEMIMDFAKGDAS